MSPSVAPPRPLPWRPLPALLACGVIAIAAAATPPPARADKPGDHERARAAVRAGEVLPLPALLQKLQRSHPGQVLELELERDDGRWIYEVKLLQPDGQLLKLDVDARTAQVLKSRLKERSKDGIPQQANTAAPAPAASR